MEYGEFVARYKAGTVLLGVDRSRIRKAVGSPVYDHFFQESEYPRLLNRLSTIFSVLIVPALLGAVLTPFLIAWWAFLPFAALALVFGQMSYRYQREAVRELALVNPMAYKFLLLEGIIVVDSRQERSSVPR